MTVFSVTVAVAAPVAAVALARIPRRWLFAVSLLVFIAANIAAATTPSFTVLMLLRVVAALAAASTTPALFAFAARHAPAEKVGRFIAVVSLGVTGSIAAGVPLGTWIGGAFGWRATFAAMAVAGAIVLVFVLTTLPRSEGPDETPVLRDQVRTLQQLPISLGLLANCVLMTGSMMMLTYLAPYLASATTAGVEERALAFSLSGIAGILGIWLGGIATDRWGADRTLLVRHRCHRRLDARTLGALGQPPRFTTARARRGHGLGWDGVLELTSDPGPPAPPRGSRLRTSPGTQHFGHLPRRLHRSRSRRAHPL